jgi:NTE family protein
MDLMSRSSVTDMLTRLFSPYEFNPLNIKPLRDLLTATVDFEALRSPQCPIKLFISATNVRTGKMKIPAGRGERA